MEATTMFEPEVMPDSHHESSARSARNVHGVERVASTVLGGLALASGLRQRSSGGAMLAILGGEMIYRGVTGVCPLYRAMGISTAGSEGKTSPVKVDWHHAVEQEGPVQSLRWRTSPGSPVKDAALRLTESDDGAGTDAILHMKLDPRPGSLGDTLLNILHSLPRVLESKAFRKFTGHSESDDDRYMP